MRSGNYGEAAPCSYCYRNRQIARPMIILVHTRESDEPGSPISDGTDDASQSRVPLVSFARKRRSHREARSGMPRRERDEWSIPIMKTAAELKVFRVTVIHRWKRSAGDSLPQTSNAGRKENRLRHVKRGTCQSRYSCQAAGRIQTRANNEWTWPAEEREIARGVLQIVASLEALLLHYHRSPGVQGRYGHGCKDGQGARRSVMSRDPWAGGASAIAVRILRTKTGCDGSDGHGRAGGDEHMQERAEIH